MAIIILIVVNIMLFPFIFISFPFTLYQVRFSGWRSEVMAKSWTINSALERLKAELDSTVKFWLQHSHDKEYGGFLHCLSREGNVFDTVKYGWMVCRQVWMYAKLYNSLAQYHTAEILEAAKAGADFISQHIKVPNKQRCYFMVSKEGTPVKLQRKPFTECFYTMAFAELSRATGNNHYMELAEQMLGQLIQWIMIDSSSLGSPFLTSGTSELGRPMMLLNVLQEVCGDDNTWRGKYDSEIKWSVRKVLTHLQRSKRWVCENVSNDGGELPGSGGRLMIPGHAIEAGWMLLTEAKLQNLPDLQKTAIDHFIMAPLGAGWDSKYGGIFYFLDVDGYDPIQLEWSMKLWWVHCETLISLLMAYQTTGDDTIWERFCEVLDYTLKHFPDPQYGEWYGYLTREGNVNQKFKGGPFKGCYHVPRCLLMCCHMLEHLQKQNTYDKYK